MYYLNSTLYEPLPAEFITDIGGIENYGNWARDLSSSPLDNILALGPYMLEDWTTDQRIVFKKIRIICIFDVFPTALLSFF